MMKLQQVREKIRGDNLDIDGAVEWLGRLGSEDDPIIYRGKEMTPRDLAAHLASYTPALEPRISFYGTTKTSSCGLIRNSNFARMIKDRLDLEAERNKAKKKAARRPRTEYHVTFDNWTEKFLKRSEAKACFTNAKARYRNVSFEKVTIEFIADQDA